MSVSYGGDSITFADNSTISSGWTGFKNRIINGAMVIDQRNGGSSITPSTNTYSLDRWLANCTVGSKYSVQQVTDAPPGFISSLKVTSTSAYSGASGDYQTIQHRIEAYNCLDLAWGTSNAKTVTVSFWVKSSVAGVFGLSLYSSTSTPTSYLTTYTINATNTWEYKTVTIPGDTLISTYEKTNGIYTILQFVLNAGSSYSSSTSNTWLTGNYCGTTGITNLLSTNAATFQITGVQLEKGSTASSFENRPYGTELQLCQRYYQVIGLCGMTTVTSTTTAAFYSASWPVAMRASPTAAFPAGTWDRMTNFDVLDYSGVYTPQISGPYVQNIIGFKVARTSGSSWSANIPLSINPITSSQAYMTLTAEL